MPKTCKKKNLMHARFLLLGCGTRCQVSASCILSHLSFMCCERLYVLVCPRWSQRTKGAVAACQKQWVSERRSADLSSTTPPPLQPSSHILYSVSCCISPSHLSHALLSHLLLHLILSFLFISSCYSHLLIFILLFLSVSLMAFFSLYAPQFW